MMTWHDHENKNYGKPRFFIFILALHVAVETQDKLKKNEAFVNKSREKYL